MPDTTIPATSTSPSRLTRKYTQPLRRGNACLMCRAKKLKCNAIKPNCSQCAKRGDRCVYDPARPITRVEELELKLAELEHDEIEPAQAAESRSESTGSTSHQPATPLVALTTLPVQSPFTYNAGNDDLLYGDFQYPLLVVEKGTNGYGDHPDVGLPYKAPVGDSTPALGFDLLTDFTPNQPPSLAFPINEQAPIINLQITQRGQAPIAPACFPSLLPPNGIYPSNGSETFELPTQHIPFSTAPETAPRLTEHDISSSTREYLLSLYFSLPTTPALKKITLLRRLISTNQHPHQCLLFAIYLTAASSSHIPAVRSLASDLYIIACERLEECVRREDRLGDGVECARMLGAWLGGMGRGLEGYLMDNKAEALARYCGIPPNITQHEMGKKEIVKVDSSPRIASALPDENSLLDQDPFGEFSFL